jgi:hypothetical protein
MTTKREADRHFQKKSQGKKIIGNAQRKVPVNNPVCFAVVIWFLASWAWDLPKLSHATLQLSSITVMQIRVPKAP